MAEAPAARFAAIADRVWRELVAAGFKGSDPYDGLNSRLLAPVLKRSRIARLAVIQGVKRSPVDLRPLLRIPPGLNPKGLALVLHATATGPELPGAGEHGSWLADALICLASRTDGSPALGTREISPGAAGRIAAHIERVFGRLGWRLGWRRSLG